jgi:hypothetical protein
MENRAIKHADWLKIVDSRQVKQSKAKSAVKPKGNFGAVWFGLFAMVILGAIIGRVMITPAAAPTVELSAKEKQTIERHFGKQFMMGSWQLSRVKFGDSDIGVYVQIPSELALSEEDQKRYIQQSLCPQGNDFIWQSVGEHGLYIHLFTNNLRKSQYAQCIRA